MDQFDREWLLDMLEYSKSAMRVLGTLDAAALEKDEKTFLARIVRGSDSGRGSQQRLGSWKGCTA